MWLLNKFNMLLALQSATLASYELNSGVNYFSTSEESSSFIPATRRRQP
jgi:hypothetical protein